MHSVTHLSSRGEILSAFDPGKDLDFGLKMAQEAKKPLNYKKSKNLSSLQENRFQAS